MAGNWGNESSRLFRHKAKAQATAWWHQHSNSPVSEAPSHSHITTSFQPLADIQKPSDRYELTGNAKHRRKRGGSWLRPVPGLKPGICTRLGPLLPTAPCTAPLPEQPADNLYVLRPERHTEQAAFSRDGAIFISTPCLWGSLLIIICSIISLWVSASLPPALSRQAVGSRCSGYEFTLRKNHAYPALLCDLVKTLAPSLFVPPGRDCS